MPTQRHTWVIDAIAEHVASIEVDGGAVVRLPQWVLPRGARAGDVLVVSHEIDADGRRSTLRIAVDEQGKKTALRKSREQLAQSSPKKDSGDIAL
jgi:hypothetical protein